MKITGVEQLIDLIDRVLEGRGLDVEERDEIFENPEYLDLLSKAVDRGIFTYAVVMSLVNKFAPQEMSYANGEDDDENLYEAFKHMPAKSQKEVEKAVKKIAKEKLKYLEKILGHPASYERVNNDKVSMFDNFIHEIELNFQKATKKTLDLNRDFNVGDSWIVSMDEEHYPVDNRGEEYQIGMTLEMDDWDGEDKLTQCGFYIVTGNGHHELYTGLTLYEFIEIMKGYYKNGRFEK